MRSLFAGLVAIEPFESVQTVQDCGIIEEQRFRCCMDHQVAKKDKTRQYSPSSVSNNSFENTLDPR